MNSICFSYERLISFLYGLSVFLILGPYFVWHNPYYKIFFVAVFFLSVLYLISNRFVLQKNYLVLLYFLVLILFLQFSSGGVKLYFSVSFLLIIPYILFSDETKVKVFDFFYSILVASLVPGLIIYFLLFFGANLPWSELLSNNALKEANGLFYRNYIATVILNNQIFDTGVGEVFRFSGMFDEPGKLGTVAALLLAAKKFNLNSFRNKIVFISGALSLSLAFYIIVIIYLSIKKPKFILVAFFVVASFGSYFYTELKSNVLLSYYVFERIDKGVGDPESLDNRASSCFISEYNEFLDSGSIYVGKGVNAHSDTGCDVSSYLIIIFNHGVIGAVAIAFFYLLIYLSVGINIQRFLTIFPFLLVFTINVYQRPDVLSLWMVVIFFSAILYEKATKDFNKLFV